MTTIITQNQIEDSIFIIRDSKVMIDRDLAELYGVTTKRLNEQVKRNIDRFPSDFMFKLSNNEKDELVAICDRFKTMKHSSVNPSVFTEHGVAMLSSVLNSKRAVQANIAIVRTFIKLRQLVDSNRTIAQKISQLERKYDRHDFQIQKLFDKTRNIPTLPEKQIKIDGFKTKK
jgi:hypothetical protein